MWVNAGLEFMRLCVLDLHKDPQVPSPLSSETAESGTSTTAVTEVIGPCPCSATYCTVKWLFFRYLFSAILGAHSSTFKQLLGF